MDDIKSDLVSKGNPVTFIIVKKENCIEKVTSNWDDLV